MPTKTIDFSRGPYGEILPPPLLAGVSQADLDDVVKEMVGNADLFNDAADLSPFHPQAMAYLLQQNLARALAGELADPDAADLCQAVLRGEPLSLRPVGNEDLTYRSFVPVFQRVSDAQWRVGVEGQGRTALVSGDAASALRQAWQIYVAWAEQESI